MANFQKRRKKIETASFLILCFMNFIFISCEKVTGPSTNYPPIVSLLADATAVLPGSEVKVKCIASDPDGDFLTYSWDLKVRVEFLDGWDPITIFQPLGVNFFESGEGRLVPSSNNAIWVAPSTIGEGVIEGGSWSSESGSQSYKHPWRQIGVTIFCLVDDGENTVSKSITIDLPKSISEITRILFPDSASEVGIPSELTIVVTERVVSSEQYPEGIKVDIQKLGLDKSLELYTILSPLAPIYRIDAGSVIFEEPIKVRMPTSNIHIPTGIELEDLQIITWEDLGDFELLPTTVGPGRKWLEATVTHFSYFTVRIKSTRSFFGSSQFVTTEPLHIALENGYLVFDNLFSNVEINPWRGFWDWFASARELPQSIWINYEVQVLRDDWTDRSISTMQIFRIVWSPANKYDAYWTNPNMQVDALLGDCAFKLRKLNSNKNRVTGKEAVVVFDERGRHGEIQESLIEIGNDAQTAGDFLRQVFRSDVTDRFLDASVIDDPDAHYYLRISREYGDWQKEFAETVVSEKFSPYDIAPSITLAEPSDNTIVQTANPRFLWHSEALPGVHVNHELLISPNFDPRSNPTYDVQTGSNQGFFNEEQADRVILEPGAYHWCVRAYNYDGNRERAETYSEIHAFSVEQPNRSPDTPTPPVGPLEGDTGISYSFSTQTDDPDGDNVSFQFDWGDVSVSDWTSYVSSGSSSSVNHSWSEVGTYSVKVKAKDENGLESDWSNSSSITIIKPPNRPPQRPSSPNGPLNGTVREVYTFSASTTDLDGDDVAFRFDWGDGEISEWTSNVPSGSSVSKNHSWSSPGTYSVKVKAKDSQEEEVGWSTPSSITITEPQVSNRSPNRPSSPSGPSSGIVRTSYSFSASTTDPDEDDVAYKFDWGDGNTSRWTSYVSSGSSTSKSHFWSSAGTYSIRVKAKDSDGEESDWSSGHFISITAETQENNPPNKPSIPGGPFSGEKGVSYTFTSTATDPNGDDVALKFYWDDGSESSWTSYVSSGSSVSINHSWTYAGKYYVRVKAKDSHGVESDWSGNHVMTVTDPSASNQPPNSPNLQGPSEGNVGYPYSFSATTTDPDGDDIAFKFDWGDGDISDWTAYVSSGSSVRVSHSWPTEGTYYVKVKAKDENGAQSDWSSWSKGTINITEPQVSNSPPNNPDPPNGPSEGTAGQSYSFSATTTDPDGDNVAFKFDWDDGNISSWTSYVSSGNSTSKSHFWSSAGTYSIKVRAKDSRGAESSWSTTITFEVKVDSDTRKANILASITPSIIEYGAMETITITLEETSGVGVSINEFYRQVYAHDALISDESYEVNIRIEGNDSFSFTGETTQETWSGPTGTRWVYSFAGVDDNSNQVTATVHLTITSEASSNPPNRPDPPNGPSEGTIGEVDGFSSITTDPDGDDIAFKFDWGDGDISDWTAYVSSGSSVRVSHSWPTEGTYYVKVKAKDENGAQSDWSNPSSITITEPQVSNRPPNRPDPPIGPSEGDFWEDYSFSATTIDPDGDEIRYEFHWGNAGEIHPDYVPSGTTVSLKYSWREVGTFDVSVRAEDSYGAVSEWSNSVSITITKMEEPNNPPNRPDPPSGPSEGTSGEPYSFSATTTDPDGDNIAYKFDWGDGGMSSWTSYTSSENPVSKSHSWSTAGTYSVRVKAKDDKDAQSSWSDGRAIKIEEDGPDSALPDLSVEYPDGVSLSNGANLTIPGSSAADRGSTGPGWHNIGIRNDGLGTLTFSVSSDKSWLTANPSSGSTTGWFGHVTLQADLDAVSGTETATVTVSSNGGSIILDVKVDSDTRKEPNNPPARPGPPFRHWEGGDPPPYMTGQVFYFYTTTVDPDEDDVVYKFDWGDGSVSDWVSYGGHSWSSEGTYYVKVKAKDSHGEESDWSTPLVIEVVEDRIEIVSISPSSLHRDQDVVLEVKLKFSLHSASTGEIYIALDWVSEDEKESSSDKDIFLDVPKGRDIVKTVLIETHTTIWPSNTHLRVRVRLSNAWDTEKIALSD